ncbi:choice-of-anchor M domain-containing protein [Saccharothrix sp. 6-C]|uniref:choice-of-anchor M domain-containing protein n=1 Tax=Saccharothrix sp. 6-C TaxID=2781735 RepID=UPI001916F251|nr:choice-of-anchor M domain-containing protein [Saccharothrix sp. 6-C]
MRTTARFALLLTAVTGLSGLAVAPATAAPVVTIDTGHVDVFGVAYEDDEFHLHVHDEAGDVEHEPSEVLLVAKAAAKTTVPADPAYAFLGAPGAPVWVLPEVEDPNLLWPGIAAEEVEPGVFVDGSLRLHVVAVCGPDDFSIFTTDAVGAPTVLVDSGNGLPDRIDLTPGGHQHANWAFEAAGSYSVTVRAVGTLAATGERVVSAPATYSFKVNR